MLYPELFKQLEAVRWNMDQDIPWDQYDARKLSDEQAQTIKMNAITEWAAPNPNVAPSRTQGLPTSESTPSATQAEARPHQ